MGLEIKTRKMCDCQTSTKNPMDNRIPQGSPRASDTVLVSQPNTAQTQAASQSLGYAAAAMNNRTAVNSGAGIITLSATGTGASVKMQSADGTVESINGTLGTEKFSVDQLPDRAGLALGGATLLGIDVLRDFLKVFAIYCDYIQYEGGSTAQLGNPLNFITGSVFGALNTDSVTPSSFANNMQQVSTLVDLRKQGGFLFAVNTALKLTVNNTVTVKITLHNCAIVPYNKPF